MIKILTSRIRDRKKFIINLLLLLCSCFFIILAFYVLNYYKYCANDMLDKNIANKTIRVDYYDMYDENKINIICNLEYVIDCYEEYSNWEFILDNQNLLLDNIVNNKKNIIQGRKVENNFEIIISSYVLENMHYQVGEVIDYENVKLKVVGVVDIDYPYVYSNIETIRYIANSNNGLVSGVFIVVDKYKNVNYVMSILKDKGYDSSIVVNLNEKEKNMNEIVDSLKFGMYLIIFISVIIIVAVLFHVNNCERKNEALLCLLGYPKVIIVILNILYELLFCIIVFIILTILYFIVYCIFNMLDFYTISFNIYLNWMIFIMSIIFVVILICLIINCFRIKMLNMLYVIEES